MGVEVTRTAAHRPGLFVEGVSADNISDPEIRRRLRDLWIDEGLLIFRGWEADQGVHVALSEVFGACMVHHAREVLVKNHQELIDIRYKPGSSDIYEVNGKRLGSWVPWHSDLIFMDQINHGGILRALTVPSTGGETGFLDKIAAYDRLPPALRDRIEGLSIVYKFNFDPNAHPFVKIGVVRKVQDSASYRSLQSRLDDFPTVIHPAVFTQPETGRKVLNVSPMFALGIAEMPGPEGDALLSEVADYCQDDRFAYIHQWQQGDMVLWDNWRMWHSARGAPADEERWMQRTTIAGDYALGSIQGGPDLDPHLRSVNV